MRLLKKEIFRNSLEISNIFAFYQEQTGKTAKNSLKKLLENTGFSL